MSAYGRPSSSRIASAARWLGGSWRNARRSSSPGRRRVVAPHRHAVQLLVECHLTRAALRLAEALAARVVRDRDQPVLGLPRPLASLERAISVQERRLRDVLGVRRIAEHRQRVAEDIARVTPVQALEGAIVTG